MNNDEAIELLEHELTRFRQEPYEQLAARMSDGSICFERAGPSGATYQIEVQVFWDDGEGGNIRVTASIDDGGWRALVPLTRDFIKAPDGSFVGE